MNNLNNEFSPMLEHIFKIYCKDRNKMTNQEFLIFLHEQYWMNGEFLSNGFDKDILDIIDPGRYGFITKG